jgi:hypothetical protein
MSDLNRSLVIVPASSVNRHPSWQVTADDLAGVIICLPQRQAEAPPETRPITIRAAMNVAEQIAQRRERRIRKPPPWSIARDVTAVARHAARTQRRLGTIIELWEAVIPSELAAHTAVTGLRGGVLFVRADSAAVAYELDRRLRDGLEQALRSRFPSTLVRIRVNTGR